MARFIATIGLTVFVVGLFITMSVSSGYNLISPFEVDLDLSLMLTPFGIIKNLLLSPTALTPYYFMAPEGGLPMNNMSLVSALILVELAALVLLFRLRER